MLAFPVFLTKRYEILHLDIKGVQYQCIETSINQINDISFHPIHAEASVFSFVSLYLTSLLLWKTVSFNAYL